MKKATKLALLVAAALVLAGCGITGTALALGGQFDAGSPREVTHMLEERPDATAIETVMVSVSEADVRILRAEGEQVYAICTENDRLHYTLTEEGGALILSRVDDRRWYERIGISTVTPKVDLYLPGGVYDGLDIRTASGDIECAADGLSFGQAILYATSGSIRFASPVHESLLATTSSGSIALADFSVASLEATASSGRVSLSDLTADHARLESASGSIELSYVRGDALRIIASSGAVRLFDAVAAESLTVETSSGDIRLDGCDAPAISLAASSGNITGALLSGKLYDVRTGSGQTDYPASVADGGTCTVRTSSGNVDLTVVAD